MLPAYYTARGPLVAACNDSGCVHSTSCAMHSTPHYFSLRALVPASPQVCVYFQNGNCKNGDACRYAHVQSPQGQPAIPGSIPCRFFASGTCRNGDACAYSHNAPLPPPPVNNPSTSPTISVGAPVFQTCTFRATGSCSREACIVSHEASSPIYSPIPSNNSPVTADVAGWTSWDESRPHIPHLPEPSESVSQVELAPATTSTYKTRPCIFYPQGKCRYGDECHYIHDINEQPTNDKVGGSEVPVWGSDPVSANEEAAQPATNDRNDSWGATAAATWDVGPSTQTTTTTNDEAWAYSQSQPTTGSDSQRQGICIHFPRGRCWRGASCRFIHDVEQTGPQLGMPNWDEAPREENPPTNTSGWGVEEGTVNASTSGWGTNDAAETDWVVDPNSLNDWGQPSETPAVASDWPVESTPADASDGWNVGPDASSAENWLGEAVPADMPTFANEDASWSLPWPGHEDVPPPRPNFISRPCLFFGQGFCAKGDRCEYKHVPQDADVYVPKLESDLEESRKRSSPPLTPPPSPPHDLDLSPRPIWNCTVDFPGDGSPANIVTSFESNAIVLSNYPAGAHAEVSELVGPYGATTTPTFQLRDGRVQARVEFPDCARAEEARFNLHGSVLAEDKLAVQLDCKDAVCGSAHQSPTQVKVVWNVPSVGAWVFYARVALSKSQSEALNGTTFNGRKITAEYFKSNTKDRFPILVKGLPPDTTQESIKQFCGGEQGLLSDDAVAQLHEPAIRPRQGASTAPSDLKIIALADFSDTGDAENAIQALAGAKHDFLGDESISVQAISHVKIPSTVSSSGTKHRALSISTADKHSPSHHVPISAQSFVFGSELSIWDAYFEDASSDDKIQHINTAASKAFHIQKDARRRVLRVWGDAGKAAKQIERLLKKVASHTYTLPLSSLQLNFLMRGGLSKIEGSAKSSSSSKLTLDLVSRTLTVFGEDELKRKIDRHLEEGVQSVVQSSTTTKNGTCCLCASRNADPSLELSCSHGYCSSCFKTAFRSIEIDRCPAVVAASMVLSRLSEVDVESIYRASFLSSARSRPEQIRFCPSGCDILFPLRQAGMVLSCPECRLNICAACALPRHPNMSCIEYNNTNEVEVQP
ncbi:RING finger protein [Mycena chlorophos]|uniref:RING finger protein n=1 Tax=Mycena chlorophos TaxID=658473 RepID=A0A8H6WA07_MYCCL|nr:RING finger protein [Mycena chlorophos]